MWLKSIFFKAGGFIKRYPLHTIIALLMLIIVILYFHTQALGNRINELEYETDLQQKQLTQNEQAFIDAMAQKDSTIQDLAVVVMNLNADVDSIKREKKAIEAEYVAYVSTTDFKIKTLQLELAGITVDGSDAFGRYKEFESDTTHGIVRVASLGRVYIDLDRYVINHSISFLPFSVRSMIYMGGDGIIRHRVQAPDDIMVTMETQIDNRSFELWAMNRVQLSHQPPKIPVFGFRFVPLVGYIFGDIVTQYTQNGGGMRDRMMQVTDRLYFEPNLEMFYKQAAVGYAPVINMAYIRYGINIIAW
jgi:hypothetical protein